MSGPEGFYGLVGTDTQPYANWQCQILAHTWHAVGQPGELVRLVAAPAGGPLPTHRHARVVRTRASNHHPVTGDYYVPYNKLFSIREWLETERPNGTVLLLDPDMVFRAPLATRVTPGAPRGQRWVDFSPASEVVVATARAAGVDPAELQPLTWPALVHTDDLARLIPHWIELTSVLRDELGIWECDMLGFVGASAVEGLRWDLDMLGAFMNWPEDEVAGAPIIHYCQPVEGRDGSVLWFKQGYQPWNPIEADPDDARLDYCRDLLVILQDFIAGRVAAQPGASSRPRVSGSGGTPA